jgi:prepilin-type N-terminal cleavage/methylation domain-containing protein
MDGTASQAVMERTKTSPTGRGRSRVYGRRSGYTLLEIVVVLILMGLAAALVVPAVLPPREEDVPSLTALIKTARQSAVRRAEVVHLTITASGDWRLDGAASLVDGPFATGRLGAYDGPPATLVASPLGACAFDAFSSAATARIALEPLTCEVRGP